MSDAPEPRIVHADDSILVIDKPAGLVVHPAPSHKGPTLVDWLGERAGEGRASARASSTASTRTPRA